MKAHTCKQKSRHMKWVMALLFICYVFNSAAQKSALSPPPRAVELYQEAIQLEKQRQPQDALKKLDEALKKAPSFDAAWLKKGDLLAYLFQKEAAIPCWEKFVELAPTHAESPRVYFALGEWHFKEKNYTKAKQFLAQYVQKQHVDDEKKYKARILLSSIDFIAQQAEKPIPQIETKALPDVVNQFAMQYFPAITVDERFLIFTARKGFGINDDENLYVSKFINGSWTAPQPISPNINTKGNEGTCSISADARVLVFTSCDRGDGLGSCDLYISYREGNTWSKPENLRAVNSAYWESQPSLSADGKKLYFISTRPGGLGGHDIWCSEMNEQDEWQTPYNLGEPINTPLDELSPFIHANAQTLFFASDGHAGMGGFDIFYSEWQKQNWTKPVNIGPPINTAQNEMALYITAKGTRAFYSKEEDTPPSQLSRPAHLQGNAKKMQNSYLYEFEWPQWLALRNPCRYITGITSDAVTGQKIAAKIDLVDLDADKTIYRITSDKLFGNYTMVLATGRKYGLFVSAEGYLYQSKTFDLEQHASLEPMVINFELTPVKKGQSTVMNNIFFDFAKYELLPASKPELRKVIQFLLQNPEAKIEIIGHTDDVGSDAENLKLSSLRANAVANYLIKNGIPPHRIQAKGMGKSKPIAPNDTDENRAQNRRIEFVIL